MKPGLPVVGRGGENIPNNTYGFEVEFCSHDNSVFAYTHIEIAQIIIHFKSDKKPEIWHLETDSGNVLELVTSPIVFADIVAAYDFKDVLTAYLVSTVDVIRGVIPGVVLGEWLQMIPEGLQPIAQQAYAAPIEQIVLNVRNSDEIQAQLIVDNIDDGINIAAAKLRLQRNSAGLWSDYMQNTVLSRSEKDWGAGYSSQVNLPMSLEGYFVYQINRKYRKSVERINNILHDPRQAARTDASVAKQVETWFWRSLLFEVFYDYGRVIFGQDAFDIELNNAMANRASIQTLKTMALLYVTLNKILTGAMGSLSENAQLQLQYIADVNASTNVMVDNGQDTYRQNIDLAANLNTNWLEYHSSMKDLTGLWFKGALSDVLSSEELTPDAAQIVDTFRQRSYPVFDQVDARPWVKRMCAKISYINSNALDALWELRDGYSDSLDFPDVNTLFGAISAIEKEVGNMLRASQVGFVLPGADLRPFLGYPHGHEVWEGRYDTMIAAIPGDNAHPVGWWKYLIEHRFN